MSTKTPLFDRGTRRKAKWGAVWLRLSPAILCALLLVAAAQSAPELRPPLALGVGLALAIVLVRSREAHPLGTPRPHTAAATALLVVAALAALALVPPLPQGTPILGEHSARWAGTVAGVLLTAVLALRHVGARGERPGAAWLVAVAARSASRKALLGALAGGLAVGLAVEALGGRGPLVAAAIASAPLASELPGAWSRRRLLLGWPDLAHMAGLTGHDADGRLRVPNLTVELVPYGHRVRARMLQGQVLDDWERATAALASGWGAIRVKAREPAPGRVELDVLLADPLVDVTGSADVVHVEAAAVPTDGSDGRPPQTPRPTGPRGATALVPVVADTLRVTVGRRQDGRPFLVDLRRVIHWLVCGETGSGKSVWLSRIFMGLAPQRVGLLGVDAKGGVEMEAWRPRLTDLAHDVHTAVELLERLLGVMAARYSWLKARGLRNVWQVPAADRPVPVVVLVDEVAALFSALDPADKEEKVAVARCVSLLVRLAEQSRAAGIHLIVGAQRPSSDLGERFTRLRAQLGGRVAHRVADEATGRMALAGMREGAMEAALAISLPGQCVVAVEGGAWEYARAELVEPEQVDGVATSTAHLRVAWEELYPPAGELAGATAVAADDAERRDAHAPEAELQPGEEEWCETAQLCASDPVAAQREGVLAGVEWGHQHSGADVDLPRSPVLAPYLAGFRAGLSAARETAGGGPSSAANGSADGARPRAPADDVGVPAETPRGGRGGTGVDGPRVEERARVGDQRSQRRPAGGATGPGAGRARRTPPEPELPDWAREDAG